MSILDEGFRAPGGTSRNRPHGNMGVLRIAILGMFLVLGIRLAQMQIVDGASYAQRSRENHIVQKNILPTRGLITDRNGEPLVENVGVYSATILPETLPDKEADRYQIYLKLQDLIGVSPLEVKARVDDAVEAGKDYIAITVANNLPKDKALALDEASVDMPGVSLAITPGRKYIGGDVFSHILGYIGPQFAEDAARLKGQNYQLNEPVGKDGLESRYEADLRGTVGFTAVEQDAYGHQIQALQSKDPVPGNSLKLSIDAGLQRYIGELLEDSLADTSGVWGDATVAAAVVMDPVTGAILAMNSLPTYDNNIWAESKIRGDELDRLAHDNKTYTLLNKALSAAAPGSTFKLVTAAAALESGNYEIDTEVDGPARLDLPQTETTLPNDFSGACSPTGKITLKDALRISCNTAFGAVGMALGGDALNEQARAFGFGEQLRIPLAVTPSQFPADPSPAQVAQSAIGQFDVRVSPLQMAMVSAAIANEGVVMKPRLVNRILAEDLTVMSRPQTEELGRAVSRDTARTLTEMMEAVVTSGTGTRAQLDGVRVAGKTGTAEHGARRPPHAWFTAFAPADDPVVAIAVVVEDGGTFGDAASGGKVAAPIAKKVMEAVISQ